MYYLFVLKGYLCMFKSYETVRENGEINNHTLVYMLFQLTVYVHTERES